MPDQMAQIHKLKRESADHGWIDCAAFLPPDVFILSFKPVSHGDIPLCHLYLSIMQGLLQN